MYTIIMKEHKFDELPPPPPPPPPPVTKVSRKRLYIVIGLVIIVIAAITVIMTTGFPLGGGETIPLILNYEEGEKATYGLTLTISVLGQQISQTTRISMEVLDFDGENYIIHYQIVPETDGYPTYFTIKINKHGNIVGELPPEIQQLYSLMANTPSIPGFGGGFPKAEARIGEQISTQFTLDISGAHITGTVNIRFSELTTKTFANIGELKVFKIDFSIPDLQVTSQGTTVTGTVNGYGYYEHGTCLLVEYSTQFSLSISQYGQTYSANVVLQINLIEHSE
ncbi:MAG: hypothetical protein QXH24_00920 [Candidatus Bathyarchaeia archaeon]